MKKTVVILCLAALFAACSKDNSVKPALIPDAATAADIMGTWKLTTDTAYEYINGQLKTVANATPTGGTITYGPNGAGTSTTNGNTTNFTYSVTDGVIELTYGGITGDFIILSISSAKMLTRATEGSEYEDVVFIKQ